MFAALYYPFDKPRRWINSGGLGTMGLAYRLALGVIPKRNGEVCVTGDGSIQMNIQELSTALRYELPVLVLNLNEPLSGDGETVAGYDLFWSPFSVLYMRSLPDFCALAEAYSMSGC